MPPQLALALDPKSGVIATLPRLKTRPFRTELTIEQNSLFVANTYKGESFVRESVVQHPESGEEVLCRLTIGQLHAKGRPRGVLRQRHQDVFYKLLELWGAEGYPVGELRGKPYGSLRLSAYKLVTSICSGDDSAGAYSKVQELLRDLQAIPIVLENVYTWQGLRDREEFSLLAEVAWSERGLSHSDRARGESLVTIVFSSLVTTGFLQKHFKTLLLEPYESLGDKDSKGREKGSGRRGETARLIYPFFDDQLSAQESFEVELDWLAKRFGLKSYEQPSKRLEKFEPAIRALHGTKILEGRFVLDLSVRRRDRDVFLQVRRKPASEALK